MRALVAETGVRVVEDAGDERVCELYPFCQQHATLETLGSLFSAENDAKCQLEQRHPFSRLLFMGNVPEQKIAQ